MKSRLLFLTYLIMFPFYGIAQGVIDSLENLLKSTEETTERIDLMNQLGAAYWVVDSKKSIELGLKSLKSAEQNNYTAGIADAKRVLGVSHWTQGNAKEAFESLFSALDIYLLEKNDFGIANCYLNMGMVYADINEYNHALELYDQAIVLFTKLNKRNRIAAAFNEIGSTMMKEGNIEEAKEYLNNSLQMCMEEKYTLCIAESHHKLGTLFLLSKEYEQADYHIRKAISYSKMINDKHGVIGNLINYGKLLRLKKQFEDSETHLKLALSLSDEKQLNKFKLSAYWELKLLKQEQGLLEDALGYFDTYVHLKDSIYNNLQIKKITALEFRNELNEKNKELSHLNKQKEKNQLILWLFIAGGSIIILLTLALIRILYIRNKKQQEFLAAKDILIGAELENQRLKQNDLERQLHFKNKELTSYALNYLQKNEIIRELKERINDGRHSTNSNKVISDIEKIIKQYQNMDKDWDDFRTYFEQVHVNFLNNLKAKFPDLSSNDMKVAALARLNLNIKETSGILGVSPESAKTARYRLRKKLQIPQEEDLLNYLIEIEEKL